MDTLIGIVVAIIIAGVIINKKKPAWSLHSNPAKCSARPVALKPQSSARLLAKGSDKCRVRRSLRSEQPRLSLELSSGASTLSLSLCAQPREKPQHRSKRAFASSF
jgi:hypothetical protein